MRVIRIYKDGKVVGDTIAFISPLNGEYQEYDLSELTDEEFKQIKVNPDSFQLDTLKTK